MLEVCLLGTGGMMPLPKRFLTALMTRLNGNGLLIDCGEGTQVAIREKGWSSHGIDVICLTHYHGDHIGGLPGLLLSMGNAERTAPVTLIGPKGLERIVGAVRCIAPGLPFPLQLHEITEAEETILTNGYEIEAFKVNHNMPCYGYSVVVRRGGRFFPELAKENDVPMKFWSRLQKGETIEEDGRVFTPELVLGPERRGIRLTYTTDTRPTQSIVEHAKNADLFICEGMYGEPDMQDKAVEKKHMTFPEAARLAKAANAKELWLTHFSPSLIYPEDFLPRAKKIFPETYAGKDGKTVVLEFDKNE